MLNKGGMLFLSTKMANFMHKPPVPEVEVADGRTLAIGRQNQEYYKQQRLAFDIGMSAMTRQLGMELVEKDPLGLDVFLKQ